MTRGNRHASLFCRCDRDHRVFKRRARLHFDENNGASAPRDDVDFAAPHDVSAGKDAIAFRSQQKDSQLFGPPAEKPGAKPPFAAHSLSLAFSPAAASAIARA